MDSESRLGLRVTVLEPAEAKRSVGITRSSAREAVLFFGGRLGPDVICEGTVKGNPGVIYARRGNV